jgi:hypothetical protein
MRVRFAVAALVCVALLLLGSARAQQGEYLRYLPSIEHNIVPTELPVGILINGDFEQGRDVGWAEVHNHDDVSIRTSFPPTVAPHSGTWAAWLGGAYNDVTTIAQQVTISAERPYLGYWYWIASADVCGATIYDSGGVTVNNTLIEGYPLCSSANTEGWRLRGVDLRPYIGQQVTIVLFAVTDGSLNSNLFIDDVALLEVLPPPPSPSPTATPHDPEECDSSYPTVCIPPPPPDLDCVDISYRNFQVLPPDPHKFDTDSDGVGCETTQVSGTTEAAQTMRELARLP